MQRESAFRLKTALKSTGPRFVIGSAPMTNHPPAHLFGSHWLPSITHSESEVTSMNWDQIEGNWKQLKGRARQKWGKLTDDELDVIAGKKEQLVGKLQERYGMARQEAEREADQWREAC
jgi:uncharacterized protein YjbJ (UPF0337 family)